MFLWTEFAIFAQLGRNGIGSRRGVTLLVVVAVVASVAGGTGGREEEEPLDFRP